MKKIYFIILLIAFSNVFCQDKIKIINTDNSVSEHSLSEIADINFDLENATIAIVNFVNTSQKIAIDGQTQIRFESNNIIFDRNNQQEVIALSDIVSIEFETIYPNRYPFGELEVDEVIVNGLSNPWSLDFIDKNNIIFTEHNGGLFRHNIATGQTQEINGVENVRPYGQGGLLDVTLDPNFDANNTIYLAYSTGGSNGYTTGIAKAILEGNTLNNFEEIFRGSPLTSAGQHFGSRIIFDNAGKLYFSIGDRGRMENAQDSTNHYGSVLRINTDGSVPSDNPYLNSPDAMPELYTMGNRNIQGMFYLPEKDEIWAVEHGPRGGDELNIIEAGENYAWPLATYGINYDGSPITDETSIPGYIDPITYWVPSIAPCGMDLINYSAENNELDIIIATLAGRHLHRIKVVNNEVVDAVESLNGYARFRDIQLSPDGYLYATTQSPGQIIKLKAK